MERYTTLNFFKESSNIVLYISFDNDRSVTKRKEIANACNKYFSALLVKFNHP